MAIKHIADSIMMFLFLIEILIYLFDKWSKCGREQADKVSRKDCRIEGGFVFFFSQLSPAL